MEYRFAKLGIHDPRSLEYGRFLRLLLASLQDGLTSEQRAKLDADLTPVDPELAAKRVHRKQHEALASQASAEYRRIMTDPRTTPEQRAEARWREMRRMAAEIERKERRGNPS